MRHAIALPLLASQALAALYLVISVGPALFEARPAGPPADLRDAHHDPATWCLALLVATGTVRAFRWGGRSTLHAARLGRRVVAGIPTGRGLLGRWIDLTFREPLVPADQARDALARLCGYRVQAGDFRIASLRPSIRRGQFGVWVTVIRASQGRGRWQCRHVRWVDDPNELWLLRACLRPDSSPVPTPAPDPRVGSPGALDADDLDELLRAPAGRPDGNSAKGDRPTSPTSAV